MRNELFSSSFSSSSLADRNNADYEDENDEEED